MSQGNNSKTIKLLFSTLFARKVNYLILGYKPNTWLYTNAHPSEIQVGKKIPDYVFHTVEFKTGLHNDILQEFPILENIKAFLDLKTFFKLLNKHNTSDISLYVNNNKLIIKYPEGEEEVGCLIEGFILDEYIHNSEIENIEDEDVVSTDIYYEDINKSDLVFKAILTKPIDSLHPIEGEVNIPIKDGESLVSCNEYIKSSKSDYKLHMYSWTNNKIVKVFYIFENKDINVTSYCPYAIYFPRPIEL